MKRRGNAMLMVLILGTAVGTVAFAGVGLAGTMVNGAARAEKNLRNAWIITGAMEKAKSDLMARRIAPGATVTYTVAGQSVTVVTEDNTFNQPNTVRLTVSGSANNRTLGTSQVIALAKPIVTTIWSHGIFSNSNFTWPSASSVTGSVYFRNSINVQATGGSVSQDFKTTSMFNPMGLINVGGAILTGLTAYPYPSLSTTRYTGAATSVLTGNQTISGYTFPVENALVVVNGNLNLTNAQISRSGTFYVTGSVTIDHLSKSDPNDHIAIITPNGITFANGRNPVVADGYFFAGSTVTVSSPLTLDGAMLGNSYSIGASMNVTWDSWIMADPANGDALKVPALWP